MHELTISSFGQGLNRPECVLAHKSGLIFVPNWTESGGISVIDPQGRHHVRLSTNTQKPIKPNGIALEPNGSMLVTHLGERSGGVYRLKPNGQLESVVTHADGHPLPPTNFIAIDELGRLWITVSTTIKPRALDYRLTANTGFVAMANPGEKNARIVASEIGYANECVVDIENAALFVNETFARRLTRFDLHDDGSLTHRRVITEFPAGTYPDGLTMDEQHNFWVTSIVSNRVIKVTPTGEQTLILEDSDEAVVSRAEAAYVSHSMGPEHLADTGNTQLKNISSLAFGGNQRSMAYLGNLLGDCLHCFDTNVRGRKPVHWDVALGPYEELVMPH